MYTTSYLNKMNILSFLKQYHTVMNVNIKSNVGRTGLFINISTNIDIF